MSSLSATKLEAFLVGLRSKLESEGMSKKNLSKMAGCSQSTISKLFNDKKGSINILEQIAKGLKTSVEDLVNEGAAQLDEENINQVKSPRSSDMSDYFHNIIRDYQTLVKQKDLEIATLHKKNDTEMLSLHCKIDKMLEEIQLHLLKKV